MDIKLVVFDWSGTVSDDIRPVYETYARMAEKFKLKVLSFDEWKGAITVNVDEFFRNQGIEGDVSRLLEIYEETFDIVSQSTMPTVYPDANNIFEYLANKGKKIAVLSLHPEKNVLKEANTYGLAYFTEKIIGGSLDKSVHLIELCKELGVSPKNTIFVGDTTFDIHAAKNAGVFSVAITRGYHSRDLLLKAKPDYIISSLSGLADII